MIKVNPIEMLEKKMRCYLDKAISKKITQTHLQDEIMSKKTSTNVKCSATQLTTINLIFLVKAWDLKWTICFFNKCTRNSKCHHNYSVRLLMFSRIAIRAIWIWRSVARSNFITAIYFYDIKKLGSFNSHVSYKILRSHSPEEFFIALAIGLLLKSNTVIMPMALWITVYIYIHCT